MLDRSEIIDLSEINDEQMQKLGLEKVPEHLGFSVCRKNFKAAVHPAATGTAPHLDADMLEDRREDFLDTRKDNHWSKMEEAGVSQYAQRLGKAWRDKEWDYTCRGQCRWEVAGEL